MAKTIFEPGDVILVNNETPALILDDDHVLLIVWVNRSTMYAKRVEINDKNWVVSFTLMSDERVKTLPFEIKLAMEAALEAVGLKNKLLNVT